MNHTERLFRSLSSICQLVLLFLLVPGTTLLAHPDAPAQTAARSNTQRYSLRQRAMNAQRQMRQYRSRTAAQERLRSQGNPAVPAQSVGITFNNALKTASKIFFTDDMEHGASGWSSAAYTGTDLWHQTTRDANSPTHSWWLVDETKGTYNSGARVNDALISPPIDLTGGSGQVTLLFTENYVTERGWDFCMVDVSTDSGSNWTHLRGGYGDAPSGSTNGWKITTLDLSPYNGSRIALRFYFDTGDTLFNDFPGWFIDNAAVYDQSGRIYGRVYFDANSNGTREGDEFGLSDWLVTMAGPITLTTRSDYFGLFNVPLPLGNYQISEQLQVPWTQTSPPGNSWNITLDTSGQVAGDADFGNYRLSSRIAGTVFNDLNHDSVRGGGEPPLAGWEIDLTDSLDLWRGNTYTDSAGQFNFFVFDTAVYHIYQTMEAGWISTVPGGDYPGYTVSVHRMDTLINSLIWGNFLSPFNCSIKGYIFDDLDHNGIQGDHEPMVAGRHVLLTGSSYMEVTTDTLGAFTFQGLPPGTFTIGLPGLYNWQQTFPESTYSVVLLDGQEKDSLIFGTYRLPLGSIRGTVFNDLNRNHSRDSLEGGLSNWIVASDGPEPFTFKVVTDSQGRFVFNDLLAGTHHLQLYLQTHWRQSMPDTEYSITLADQENKDSVDYGVYALRPGTISGTVFNDLNANAARDPGEGGFSAHEVQIRGAVNASVMSDDSGHYQFDGLWPGPYQVSTVWYTHWRQTFPASLQPHNIMLTDEEDRTGADFGLTYDTAFSLAFRTFLPESLALAKDLKAKTAPILLKAYQTTWKWTLKLEDYPVGDSITALYAQLALKPVISSVTINHPGTASFSGSSTLLLTFDHPLAHDDTLIVSGYSLKWKTQIVKRWWPSYKDSLGVRRYYSPVEFQYILPMPNAINVLFTGAGTNLRVGIGGPHSVVHKTYKYVLKSLVERYDRMHLGDPRCIGVYANSITRSINRQQSYLTPTKGNNKLFSEAIALKTNIRASELYITPPGFGNLIFREDSVNDFNGFSVSTIALKLDTAMSGFNEVTKRCTCDMTYFNELYRTVRMIDSAFCGPIDTLSFGTGLVLQPVRALSGVPFLHLDSAFAHMGGAPPTAAEIPALPDQFRLEQNYPNPFNPTTTIEFYLTQPSIVTLKVYNMLGQEVATLLDRQQTDDGWNQVELSADDYRLASGVYFYRIVAETVQDEDNPVSRTYTMVKKMMLIK